MNAKKCIIVSGGKLNNPDFIREQICGIGFMIAADGGVLNAYTLGIQPNIAIGDFDSIEPDILEGLERQGVTVLRYPRNKDYSDTQLALLKAIELGFSDITMVSALGGRIDHTLANVMLLALPEASGIKLRILDDGQEIFLIKDEALIQGEVGLTVSLLPLSENVTGIQTSGLLYEVPQNIFVMGIPNGISNIMTLPQAQIRIATGLLKRPGNSIKQRRQRLRR